MSDDNVVDSKDCLKELVGTQSFKQEPYSSLDENDTKPVEVSQLEGANSFIMEQKHNTDIKSEVPVDDCKPVLKELVAVVTDTLQIKTEPDADFSDVDAKYESTSLEPQCKNETEEGESIDDVFQGDITENPHILSVHGEQLHRQNANGTNASPVDTEITLPKTTEANLLDQVQKSEETYFCDLCGKSIKKKCHLIRHMVNHMNKQQHVCNVCELAFSRRDSLKRHRSVHVAGAILRCHVCDVCGKGFTHRHNFERHRVVHGNGKAHVCDLCGKTFTQLGDLRKHATVHTGRELQKCDTCGKCYQQRTSLLRHQVHHSKDKLLYCDFCGRGFTRKDCLHSHMLQHIPQKPFICKYCGKGYTQPASFQAHIYKHHGQQPFSCADCDKCFTSAAVLKQHVKFHCSQKSHEVTKLQQTY